MRTYEKAPALVAGAVIGALAFMGLGVPASYAATGPIVDDALAACVNTQLKREATAPITEADVASLTGSFSCSQKGVSSIEGLEFASGITHLSLNNNGISDVSPLANLTQLESIQVQYNSIADLEPFSGLVNLTRLEIHYNSPELSSLDPLAGLTNLKRLEVNVSKVSDLSPLSNLEELTELTVNNSLVTDVAPLTELPLTHASLSGNYISDVSPLSGIPTLKELRVGYNEIGDLSSFPSAPATRFAGSQEPVLSSDVRYVPAGATSYSTAFDWTPKSWGGTPANAGIYDPAKQSVSDAGEPYAGVVRDFAVTDKPYLTTYFAASNPDDKFTGVARVQTETADFMAANPVSGTVDDPYEYQFQITDGFPVATWTATNGELPAGLTLSNDGRIEGTPTASGSSIFTVTATDIWGNTLSTEAELSVEAVADPAIALSHDRIEAGETLTVTGTGYRPGEKVTGTVRPTTGGSVDLGSVEADANGKVIFSYEVPADAALGGYNAELSSAGRTIAAPFEVVSALEVGGNDPTQKPTTGVTATTAALAQTGADNDALFWAAIVALVTGAALTFFARKRILSA